MARVGTEEQEGAGAACSPAEPGDPGCPGRAHHRLGGPLCHNRHAAAFQAGAEEPPVSL